MARKTHPGANKKVQKFKRRSPFKRKACRFCIDKVVDVDFKSVNILQNFVTDRGKIIAGRVTGCCAKHQRLLTLAIKRARDLALMPYAGH